MVAAIVKVTWSSLEQTFASAVEGIKDDKNELENEARAANIDIGFVREAAAERRHQAVMAIIPAALKRTNLIESTVIVPHARNRTFIGRVKELERINKYFSELRLSEDTEPNIVTIRGIGGETDATVLLHQIDPGIPEHDLVRKIVVDLKGLPLAICQMGSYIRQSKCTLDQFYGQGLIEEAKKNAKKALDLVESYNGLEDFRTNLFRFTYADVLAASGEGEEGLSMHEYILNIRKRVMGVENNDTGVSYYGLSCLYQQLGRLEDALNSIANAIKVFTQVSGAEDRIARSYFRKHLILKDLGWDAESRVALGEARRYRQALSGNGVEWNDTMQDYDFLVSYYNK
ncbi:MAG: hypothetical protein Q9217_006330 [Psora testacea]